jgi:flagellar basal body-associated protein FliL
MVPNESSETDSLPPNASSGAMPWLVPLLIALGVVCLLVALAAGFFVVQKRRAASAAKPARNNEPQNQDINVGIYSAAANYSSLRLGPESADEAVYDIGKLRPSI